MGELKSYIYIDENGIDSLIAQINNELIIEQHEQKTHTFQGTAGAHVGLPKVLKVI